MDNDRTHLLLTELESNNLKEEYLPTDKEIRKESIKHRHSLAERLNDKSLLVLHCAMQFLDSDQQIVNLLLLNKKVNETLKNDIYTLSLLKRSMSYEQSVVKRKHLWTYFLQIPEIMTEYTALRDKVIKNPEIIG